MQAENLTENSVTEIGVTPHQAGDLGGLSPLENERSLAMENDRRAQYDEYRNYAEENGLIDRPLGYEEFWRILNELDELNDRLAAADINGDERPWVVRQLHKRIAHLEFKLKA